ncbi:phosphate signaling complex protein PhoU [Thiohalorhabdus methylotrophus]|uniref:Phosphate-specific transport system accessory protein PhoU n=1 Tax=Thiohalorhabdus methylotrophus TaxID=3242694 RepID=A0ABV4TSR3_9GAMM
MQSRDHHISHRYDQELEALRDDVLNMGSKVEEQIENAVRALTEGSEETAEGAIREDHAVNAMEVAADEKAVSLLARRTPAARDLRFVMTAIKTITDLERMGDEAEKIARMAKHLSGRKPLKRNLAIPSMSEAVRNQTRQALDALAAMDAEAALRIHQEDAKIDEMFEGIFRELLTYMMEDSRNISATIDILFVAKALERIGDHSKNITEYVIYMVHGKDVRHTDVNHLDLEEGEG